MSEVETGACTRPNSSCVGAGCPRRARTEYADGLSNAEPWKRDALCSGLSDLEHPARAARGWAGAGSARPRSSTRTMREANFVAAGLHHRALGQRRWTRPGVFRLGRTVHRVPHDRASTALAELSHLAAGDLAEARFAYAETAHELRRPRSAMSHAACSPSSPVWNGAGQAMAERCPGGVWFGLDPLDHFRRRRSACSAQGRSKVRVIAVASSSGFTE